MFKKILKRTSLSDSREGRYPSSLEGGDGCSPSPEPQDKHASVHWEEGAEENKLPDCLVRSKKYSSYNGLEGVYIYERRISFQRGPEVNVMRGKDEGCCAEGEVDYRRKRVRSTLLSLSQGRASELLPCDGQKSVISSAGSSDTNVGMCKTDQNSDIEYQEYDDGQRNVLPSWHRSHCSVKSDFNLPKKLANHSTEQRPLDVPPPITNNKLTIELETSDRLISRKMEICHNAQLIECQELCSLYETVSQLDVQMSHCKKLLTEAMSCDEKQEALKYKENLLGLHFKMMTVQFHVRLHKEFLAIKEKSFQDLLSAKSCIKDTTALIACLTSSMDDVRLHSTSQTDVTLHSTSQTEELPSLIQFGEATSTPNDDTTEVMVTEDEVKVLGNEIPNSNTDDNSPGRPGWYCTDSVDKELNRNGARRRWGMLSDIIIRQHNTECLTRPLGG